MLVTLLAIYFASSVMGHGYMVFTGRKVRKLIDAQDYKLITQVPDETLLERGWFYISAHLFMIPLTGLLLPLGLAVKTHEELIKSSITSQLYEHVKRGTVSPHKAYEVVCRVDKALSSKGPR